MLEQLFRKVCDGVFFLILANKELHNGYFLKYFKAAILKNSSERLFLQGFRYTEAVTWKF